MVKKKSRRKIIKAPIPKLDTIFNCPCCGHKKTVAVNFDKKNNKGYLRCKACKKSYEANLRRADTFIDIYYKWVNKLEQEREKELEEENELEQNEDDDFDENEGGEEHSKHKDSDEESNPKDSEEHSKHKDSEDFDKNDDNEENEDVNSDSYYYTLKPFPK